MEGYQSVASPKTCALDCDWPLACCSWGHLFKGAGSICSLGPKVAPSLPLLAEQGGQVSRQSQWGLARTRTHAPPRVNASAPFRHVCLRWEGPLRKAGHRQKGEMLDSQEDGPLKAFEFIWSRRLDCSLPCATLVCKLSSRHAQTPTAFVGSFPWKPPQQIPGACGGKKAKESRRCRSGEAELQLCLTLQMFDGAGGAVPWTSYKVGAWPSRDRKGARELAYVKDTCRSMMGNVKAGVSLKLQRS